MGSSDTVLLGVFLGAAFLLTAAGCGAASKRPAAVPKDPGAAVLRAAVAASSQHRDAALWDLLSLQARRRLGPTFADFHRGAAIALRRRLALFSPGYRVVVSERLTGAFGVVGITRRGQAFAAALRRSAGRWKLELGGPVTVRALGPRPGSRQAEVHQIAGAVDLARGSGYATMWLDGLPLDTKIARLGFKLTMYVNLPSRVSRGSHTVVAFASAGGEASALAWRFASAR